MSYSFTKRMEVNMYCMRCRKRIKLVASYHSVNGYMNLYVDGEHECVQAKRKHEPNLSWHVHPDDKDQYYDKTYEEYYGKPRVEKWVNVDRERWKEKHGDRRVDYK